MSPLNSILRFALALALGAAMAAPVPAQSKNKNKDPDQIGDRDVGTGINFYSLEKEIALGKQLAQEVEREVRLVQDPLPAEYINRLAQNLARNSDLKIPVTAKMIAGDQVNAFALPGGFLFVNSGLVLKAETEAELAGAIAHELAHVAARHGTRQASRGQLLNIASIPLIFLGGWPGYAIRQGVSLALPVTFLKFSRSFEREADLLALQYVYRAGYDPTAFVDFFERIEAMEKKKPGTVSELFRTHPSTASRIKDTQANLTALLREKPEYVVSTSEFAEVQQQLARSLNRRRAEPATNGPTLRRAPASDRPAEDDERPTLKRRQP